MIVVKLEMWPGGKEELKYDLGRTYIWNRGGTEDGKKGDYGVAVCRKGAYSPTQNVWGTGALRKGIVENYPRLSYNVWRLVIRALKDCFKEEK